MSWDPTVAGSTSQSSNQGAAPVGDNVVPSAARTASGASGGISVNGSERVNFLVDVTTVSGMTPSMSLAVEWSHNGAVWFPADPVDSLGAAVTEATRRVRATDVKARFCRVVWTITGTTPSFTFAVHAHLVELG